MRILLHLLICLDRGDSHDVDWHEGARWRDWGETGNHKPAGFTRSETSVSGVPVELNVM